MSSLEKIQVARLGVCSTKIRYGVFAEAIDAGVLIDSEPSVFGRSRHKSSNFATTNSAGRHRTKIAGNSSVPDVYRTLTYDS